MKISKRTISLILSGAAVFGVGLTGWLSVKCHDNAKEKTEKLDKVIAYGPAVFVAVATGACIIGAQHVNAQEIATLTATCSCIAANKTKIQETLTQQIGPEQAREVTKNDTISFNKKRSIEATGNGTLLCYEEYSARFFYSSLEAVQKAEEKLTDRYQKGYSISLNDFYDLLGIERSAFGKMWGWIPEFDIRDKNGERKHYDSNPLCFDDYFALDEETNKQVLIIRMYNFPSSNWYDDTPPF